MFAAIGVAPGSGRGMIDALRLAVAAGSLNATRRGLGSGHEAEIERILGRVEVKPMAEFPGGTKPRQAVRSAKAS
jgi:fructose-1-phosphate kinase PfkB-like protein